MYIHKNIHTHIHTYLHTYIYTYTPTYIHTYIHTYNNGTLPRDWKSAVVVPIHKGGDRSSTKNYRPVSLTSVVCRSMEHFITGYVRKVWDDRDWL